MGVKSLWKLLTPVGRPVMLESMEGKSMAIDSSIWIYQFQATMRDKDGRVLVNAHVLGFLRRICKLLFYGIKPVFVFDGGAPLLKRATISERKKKKSGAAETHARVAERLLAAQMRREAIAQAQSKSLTKSANGVPQGPVTIDEDTVFLEDLDDMTPVTPAKEKGKEKEKKSQSSSTKKKTSVWHDYDPYRLPDVDMDDVVAKARSSRAPDPRLATEEELRDFIDQMRPQDFDVTSPEFKELPTEVKYEIIGDLRLKSRQTSYKRLQKMLAKSRTALDFSKNQIRNLKQRNELTQRLLETTDSIGKAHVSIPVRIASERNRQYVLIKNESEVGGWVLGIRDEGTVDKPIEIDPIDDSGSEREDDDDFDMEEVNIGPMQMGDPDLREFQRELAVDAAQKRRASAYNRGRPKTKARPKLKSKPKVKAKPSPKRPSRPLFIPEEGEIAQTLSEVEVEESSEASSEDEYEMAVAVQASLEDKEAEDMQRAIELSKEDAPYQTPRRGSSSRAQLNDVIVSSSDDELDDLYLHTPSRLDTQLTFANTPHTTAEKERRQKVLKDVSFDLPVIVLGAAAEDGEEDDDMEEVEVVPMTVLSNPDANIASANPPPTSAENIGTYASVSPSGDAIEVEEVGELSQETFGQEEERISTDASHGVTEDLIDAHTIRTQSLNEDSIEITPDEPQNISLDTDESDNDLTWSRSPSPEHTDQDPGPSTTTQHRNKEQDWDAAQEINVHEEEGEFARFVSQVKGKDLDVVRREIDDEIRTLNQQRKAAMRDSEDVTAVMVAQIMTMLRLFGIPYITAPMEAEAQCAELVNLGLVDGVITDDSDAFLFGAQRVYKNMFNQSKTVECFLMSDLDRELGLDRGTLIRLAYLLGSDYVAGLPGVGPVVAMELLHDFPGEDGLHKFKDWWTKVQTGKDKENDTNTKFRRRFKKKFKKLYLSKEWPNPAVRDAYYHPVVDSSEEPFKWAMPDLDGLRGFFMAELSWNTAKVDELLLPIIHKMNRRNQAVNANRQGTLGEYLNISAGLGNLEPRRREAYKSHRLQEIVSEHRAAKRKVKASNASSGGSQQVEKDSSEEESSSSSLSASPPKAPAKKRKMTTKTVKTTGAENKSAGESAKSSTASRGKARGGSTRSTRGGRGGRGKKSTRASRGKARNEDANVDENRENGSSDDEFVVGSEVQVAVPSRDITLRPRPKPKPAYKGAEGYREQSDSGS